LRKKRYQSFSLSSPSVCNSLSYIYDSELHTEGECRVSINQDCDRFQTCFKDGTFCHSIYVATRPSFLLHAPPIRPRLMALYKYALIDRLRYVYRADKTALILIVATLRFGVVKKTVSH